MTDILVTLVLIAICAVTVHAIFGKGAKPMTKALPEPTESEGLRQQLQAARDERERFVKLAEKRGLETLAAEAHAEKAEAELASLKAAGDGWIPCAERVPKSPGSYQVCLLETQVTEGYFTAEKMPMRQWKYRSSNKQLIGVTHWRTLPPSPVHPVSGPAAKEGK